MKKLYWFKTSLFAMALGTFTACNDDDNGPQVDPTEPPTSVGAYLLNTGHYKANNASIQWYDYAAGTVSGDLFQTANNRGIGDAQDLCVYGSKVYITSSTSAKLEIVRQQDFKTLKTLPLTRAGKPVEARYLTATGGNVYFTAYDGTVSRLDTLSLTITKTLTVGDHPEGITHAGGKLYVNISGYGKGSEVAVIDLATFTKIKDLKVKLNPNTECLAAADGYVYLVSNGNYAGSSWVPEADWVYQSMQRIDPATDAVTDVCNATYIANRGDKMYILYAEYYLPKTHSISVYDLKTKTLKPFLPIEAVPNPSFIAVDPTSGDVYIGNQVKDANDEVYVFDEKGTFKQKLQAGYYTTGVRFLLK
ncbi:MAG: hypothetical protein RR365_03675 [Bacteroides sp.]